MNILLTNDDGYKAEGINFLKNYFLKKQNNVYMVAPNSEKSGTSHSLTLFRDPVKLADKEGNVWALEGTPADCVILALLGLIPEKVDVVISGINHGPNIGRDIYFSGTAGAARQGGFLGLPALALSINTWKKDFHFEIVADFLDKYFGILIKKANPQFFYNINFPNIPLKEIKGTKKTSPCIIHNYENRLVHFDSPLKQRYFWIDGSYVPYHFIEGTDAEAINNGYISVTPVKTYPEAIDLNIEFL